ncbi:hypothetical protein J6S37_01400 [Candidatus Saccharibacteria bacterium]|nr:hypothetical protein [Candidatus Saccharibacteria bacterium]
MNPSNDNPFGSLSSGGPAGGVGSGSPISAPISSGSGDIVLNNGEKKSKKGLLVGGLVALVVLAIVLVVVLIVLRPRISNQVKGRFNAFANYVLYGEEKNTEINPELDLSYDYYFVNNDDKVEVYDKTEELFGKFIAAYGDYSGEDLPGKQYLNDRIRGEKELLAFMRAFAFKNKITFSDLLAKFREGGKEGALAYAEQYYELPSSEENSYTESFLEDYDYWVEDVLGLLDFYNSNGCLVEESEMAACIIGKGNAELSAALTEKTNELERSERFLRRYDAMSDRFVLWVFVLNAQINDGDVSQYVTTVSDEDEEEEVIDE